MVSGSSKRVVVVDSPDKHFEQAIFIVGDAGRGVTSRELLEEARRVARAYTGAVKGKRRRFAAPPLAWTALGGALMGALWAATAWV